MCPLLVVHHFVSLKKKLSVSGSHLRREETYLYRFYGTGHHFDVSYCTHAHPPFYFCFYPPLDYFVLNARRIVYFIAVALTAAVLINERKQGLLDRSIVAGTTPTFQSSMAPI